MAGKIIADQIQSTAAGTVDTKYVVKGSAKAWAFTNNTGTTINDSLNISSLGDTDTGKQLLSFTSTMGNANYMSQATANSSQNDWGHAGTITKSTSQCDTTAYDAGGSYQDNRMDTIFLGDLA
jgi:hypothetical protein